MKHRRPSRTVLLSSAVGFVAGALASWGVGALADAAVDQLTSDGPLAVDTGSSSIAGVLVPGSAEVVRHQAYSEEMGGVERWARALGGTLASPLTIDLIAYGLEEYPVIITGIHAIDVRCVQPQEDWTFVAVEGGGALYALWLEMTLDGSREDQSGVPIPSNEAFDLPVESWQFPRQVSQAEADHFAIDVKARGSICEFYLEVQFTARGNENRLRITDGGRRFAVGDPDLSEIDLLVSDLATTSTGG